MAYNEYTFSKRFRVKPTGVSSLTQPQWHAAKNDWALFPFCGWLDIITVLQQTAYL